MGVGHRGNDKGVTEWYTKYLLKSPNRKEVKPMEEMRVYIVNLGTYNEGNPIGGWFTCPVDEDEVADHLELNGAYEEYAIHDYELPFEIAEYTPLEELNRLCEMAEEFIGTPLEQDRKSVV